MSTEIHLQKNDLDLKESKDSTFVTNAMVMFLVGIGALIGLAPTILYIAGPQLLFIFSAGAMTSYSSRR